MDVKGITVTTFKLAPAYTKFHAYCTQMNLDSYDDEPLTNMEFNSTIISNDEDTSQQDATPDWDDDEEGPTTAEQVPTQDPTDSNPTTTKGSNPTQSTMTPDEPSLFMLNGPGG